MRTLNLTLFRGLLVFGTMLGSGCAGNDGGGNGTTGGQSAGGAGAAGQSATRGGASGSGASTAGGTAPATGGGGASSAGSSGAAAGGRGSLGGAASSGGTSFGGAGGGGVGSGSGGQPQILHDTLVACGTFCDNVKAACPNFARDRCYSDCSGMASRASANRMCEQEVYVAFTCAANLPRQQFVCSGDTFTMSDPTKCTNEAIARDACLYP